jgi:hypothetical protein
MSVKCVCPGGGGQTQPGWKNVKPRRVRAPLMFFFCEYCLATQNIWKLRPFTNYPLAFLGYYY